MLTGFYREGDITVDLRGYDISDVVTFYLSCPILETREHLDRGIITGDGEDAIIYPPKWEDLYVSVGLSNISVSCYTMEEGGKTYKNDINKEFFSNLGSIIRGMKQSCHITNRDDYYELNQAYYDPKKIVSYTVEGKGSISLEMGSIHKLSYRDELTDTELVLEEDYSYDLKVNKQTSRQHNIKLKLSDFLPNKDNDVDSGWDILGDNDVYSLHDIIEANPDKSYAWLNNRLYHVVTDIKEVEEVCMKIWNHKGIVSFDTETTGLNITFKSRIGQGDRLVGLVFSIEEGEAWYFPIAHKKIDNICTPKNENFIIDKYFKPILEKKDILCHGGSYDWKVMHIYNICINLVHDTLILFQLTLKNENSSMSLALKKLTHNFLNRDSFELSDFVAGKWGSSDVKFWDLPYNSVKYYACPDTDNTLGLFNFALKSNLFEKYNVRKVYEVEVAFSTVIAYQEFYGHCVDIYKASELQENIKSMQEKAYASMVELVGHDFKPGSTKDLKQVMFSELGYPVIFKTKTGAPSTDKKALKWYNSKADVDGNPIYPFARYLKSWKESSQLESNFIKVLDKLATEDGFMFSEVNQFLETGRVSVSSPNYQSYNDTVKHYIIPREGYYMMDSDYSSVEYRILASMAGQQNLIESFKDPDTDYHSLQASRMFGVPYELVTKELRSQAKGVNFGLPYGMADPSLGEHIFGTKSPENTLKASKLRKLYFEGQDCVEQFFIKARADGVRNSYAETHFGRRRSFDKRKVDRSSIERASGNHRIQGTAADIYKIAMVRLFTEIRKNGWMGKVLISAFVHDECVIEVHKSINPTIMLRILRECLMLEIPGWCPLYIGAGFGTNWYDAKKTEIPVQVQDIMIDTWGTEGLEWWDGNTSKLFDWEVGLINDYKRDRVINYLKNEENWGKVLKPVENGFAHEVLEELLNGRHVDGVIDKDIETKKDTVDNLEQFCKAFGVMDLFTKADIQRPDYSQETNNTSNNVIVDEEDEDDVDYLSLLKMKTNQLGVGLDNVNNKVYFRFDEDSNKFMNLIHSIIQKYPGTYEVLALKNDEIFTTGMSMSLKGYRDLLSAYLTKKNLSSRV